MGEQERSIAGGGERTQATSFGADRAVWPDTEPETNHTWGLSKRAMVQAEPNWGEEPFAQLVSTHKPQIFPRDLRRTKGNQRDTLTTI